MFTVYSCCQPFRLLQSVPPNITSFRYEMDSKWTVRNTAKKPSAGYRDAEHLSMLCVEL